ncbi:MAG TPA: hypothetical protein EYP33_03495, partial [Pyrodictium sp.]|nr:hypothetical protein [Pyrodictium sp.]
MIQDANTYYQIENTDNYGAREIAKYVNGVKVDVQAFTVEYTQGVNYTVTVNFSPTSTTVEAFGEVLVLNTDTTAITVNSFSVNTLQQDAFYDNIVYSVNETGSNIAPIANAGLDQNVEVNQTLVITGSGTDSDGTVVSYAWKKEGNSTVLATTASFSYTPNTVGTDTLTLTVTDNNGSIGTDSMDVTVTAVPVANRAPVANAGVDQGVNTGSTVILDGSGSSDPDGDTLSYQWVLTTVPEGSTATLLNDTSVSPSFVADVDGSYTLSLEVNDGTLGSTVDTVVITATTLSASFSDDFTSDTTGEYTTVDTWTQGGVGSFNYDSAGARVEVLTGNDIALSFSRALGGSASEGSFSIDFLPTVFYPSGGIFTLKLIQDANTYYQ